MAKLPALKPSIVVKMLERAGFIFVRQKGSHIILIKGLIAITVPLHNKDMRKGTLRKIISQTGCTVEEFLKF